MMSAVPTASLRPVEDPQVAGFLDAVTGRPTALVIEGEAGVLAAFAENFAHQIRCAIEHLRMAAETLGAMHIAFDADDLADVFQIAGGRL